MTAPTDNAAYRYPVSVKGVVVCDGHIILLKNERDEWELPGGKLDPGETPEQCVIRELTEELGIAAKIGPLLDAWVYEVAPAVRVLIVTYGIAPLVSTTLRLSSEHKALGLFAPADIPSLAMPDGYKRSIGRWLECLN